jgi:hypothetical protein
VNYLLASLVRSSFAFSLAKIAKAGHVSIACTPNAKPGFPMRRDIPAQRNHAVTCERIGYVLDGIIGDEGNGVLLLPRQGVKCILIFSLKSFVCSVRMLTTYLERDGQVGLAKVFSLQFGVRSGILSAGCWCQMKCRKCHKRKNATNCRGADAVVRCPLNLCNLRNLWIRRGRRGSPCPPCEPLPPCPPCDDVNSSAVLGNLSEPATPARPRITPRRLAAGREVGA